MAYPSARVADFSVSPQPAVRYSPTTFTSTERCVAAPCTYRWFHGDAVSTDQFGTGTIASFTYTGPGGTRTVTLKVIDRRNREAVRTRSFQLVEPSSPSPAAQCSDGRDNDGDGATDYPADAGCSSATDNDESNIVTPPTGFPSASSTGVPSGATLTPGGGLTINAAGAVVDGREITGAVVVNAPNVTIRNSRIRSNAFRVIENNSTGLVIEDSEIINRPVAGQPNCHNGIGWGNFTMRRVEITGCENAVDVGGGTVVFEDSYVHDLDTVGPSYVWGNRPHTDGIQGAGDNVTVRHNWIDPSPGSGVTAGIIMMQGSDNPRSYRIEDNYIDGRGASYAIYAPRVQTAGVVINRNRLLKGYGYTACVRLGVTVAEFADNRDAITGSLLSPDNGFDGGCSN